MPQFPYLLYEKTQKEKKKQKQKNPSGLGFIA